MSEHEEKKGYDVEPAADKQTGKAKIEADPLIDGFEEDADFDHDPEVAAALGVNEKKKPKPEGEADPSLVREGMGPWRVWAVAGGVMMLTAVVLASLSFGEPGVFRDRWYAHAMLVIYNGLLHTGTGVAALFFAAQVLEKPFGSVELATGRMAAAMGAFLVAFHLPINLLGQTKIEELLIGALAYVGVLALTFRPGRVALAIIAGAHMILWVIVQFGMMLSQWTVSAPSAA